MIQQIGRSGRPGRRADVSLYDPLNSPPPITTAEAIDALQRAAERLLEPPKTPLEQLLEDLGNRGNRYRIRRMAKDYKWLAAQARKRCIDL